jgi:predicted transcriptional regulator
MMPVHQVVSVSSRSDDVFETYAVCQSINADQFDETQVYRAVMLFFPRKGGETSENVLLKAGTSCRICERRNCVARREPSILADGL